jgi:cytochrome c5
MRILYVVIIMLVLSSCDRHRNHPGWDYFPDMFYSIAYETYGENPNFEDGKTMRTPVAGTIARDQIPFEYTISAESRAKAGEELTNPFKPGDAHIERGKTAYEIFCNDCHGPAGTGEGYLFTSGMYPLKPRPVTGPPATPLSDGAIYHTITLGFGSMGPHGALVLPDDRWKIILYIRQLQQDIR